MILINEEKYEYKNFPDGTPLMKFYDLDFREYCINWIYESNEEMMPFYFLAKRVKECCRRHNGKFILDIPYLPNARMDRVKSSEDIFTLKYFCEFINSLEFDEVWVRDVHSNVSKALLNNIKEEPMSCIFDELFAIIYEEYDSSPVKYYPDEGASKRYSDIISGSYLFGIKKRDWGTGKIKGLDVMGDIPEGSFDIVIIDDICSYGGTIYHSAKKLKELGANRIFVYVTHCENSILLGKFGDEQLPLMDTGLIEKLYTTNSIFTKEHPKIEII